MFHFRCPLRDLAAQIARLDLKKAGALGVRCDLDEVELDELNGVGSALLAVTAATFVIPFAVAELSMARVMPASWAYQVPGRAPRPGRALCAVPGAFLRIAEYRTGGRAGG